ncbi:hypothetical protein GCM10023189_45670 [Nibrella saemangeumensis]|uniref:Vitellogenin II n=1 Tax=Nibrella saemangeumensis TaxID=1084526 RepID=A0ABP8NH12_9BACT
MRTSHTWKYITMLAVMGLWGCSSSRQTAQNAGEVDDLYGNSSDAVVYAGTQPTRTRQAERPSRVSSDRQLRDRNPEYSEYDEQRGYDNEDYYTDLSTRKLQRGISADPGWSNDNAYRSGFADGYNSAAWSPGFNSWRWNRWGWNNSMFWNGFNIGVGMGMMPMGMAYGYSPWGFNSWNRFYDPFWGPNYAYGGFGSFYDPWGYSPYGYGYNSFYGGGFYGRPVIVSNSGIITGPATERARTYGARNGGSSDRYNNAFNNTPRTYTPNNGGRRAGTDNAGYTTSAPARSNSSSNDGYYARPRQNSRGSYYYENPSNSAGRTSSDAGSYRAPSNSSSNDGYYARPRQNSRGSYTPAESGYNSGARGSYQNQSPQYQAPRQQQQPTYQPPSRSADTYSAPSSGSRGGGYSAPSGGGGGSSSGGSRGPR